jgi:RHS repeat-associated protein
MRDYASDGTLTARGDGQTLGFDARGRLVTATDSGGLASWKYLFDAEGRRMAKIDLGLGQASTRTSYSGNWEVTNESDFQGTPLREWVRAAGIDEHLVLIDYTQPGPDSKLYWYHSSDMGHVGALTDEQGSVVELVRYGALGEAQILAPDGVTERASSVIGNPYHFQGLWWDGETSTYHNRHRQYDPESGEYLSPDPAGLWRHGQGNGYSAFGSDPWNRRDPWGLNPGDDVNCPWTSQGVLPPGFSPILPARADEPSPEESAGDILKDVGWELLPVIPYLAEGRYGMAVLDIVPIGKLRKAPKVAKAAWKLGGTGARWGWGKAKKFVCWVRGGKAARGGGKGLTTPGKFFGGKTAKDAGEALGKKFGPPRSSRPGADTFYNPKSGRSYNVHTDPAHGPPHVDIRTRGPVPDRKVPLGGGN